MAETFNSITWQRPIPAGHHNGLRGKLEDDLRNEFSLNAKPYKPARSLIDAIGAATAISRIFTWSGNRVHNHSTSKQHFMEEL